jgi:predicted ribosome quality control (RQC) complex YloA/Tae2 family protein
MDFLTSAEFTDSTVKTLYVELMGRYSNIILTENGRILGGNRGINMFDNGVRPLIVGQPYVFPPVGEKKHPGDKELIKIFDGKTVEELAELVCKNVQGIAQSTAMEIVLNYTEKHCEIKQKIDGEKFFEYLNFYLYNTVPSPCVLINKNEVKDVLVYPYKTIVGERIYFDKLSLAEEYYFTQKEMIKDFRTRKERLSSIANSHVKKIKKKLTAINSKIKDAEEAEINRIKGELLLANIYKFKGGEKECELENYYDNSTVKIALDERLSASENAENYYKKYNKQKRTLVALEPQKNQAESELRYLIGLSEEIELAETVKEVKLVKAEMETSGLIVEGKNTYKTAKKVSEKFYREYCYKSFRIRAGRNNAENEKLTFTSMKEDIWVHVKDYHSSHVLIESGGKEIPDEVIGVAAEISAYYSKGRNGGKTEVVYTKRKYVKKPPKSKLGFCTYENFKSIIVEPKKHEEILKVD